MSTDEAAKKPLHKKWWFWFIVIVVVGALGQGRHDGEESAESPAERERSFDATLAAMSTTEQVGRECAKFQKELADSRDETALLRRNNPVFLVKGEVNDRDELAVQIFGMALVEPGTGEHWASTPGKRNIVVLNPRSRSGTPTYYLGEHYFLKKDSGRNAFGAEVPVWIFGGPPAELAKAIRKLEALEQKDVACIRRWNELERERQ